MRRLLSACLACFLSVGSVDARPILLARGKIAAGASVGVDWPVAQDDAQLGPAFAALARYGLSSRFALEPMVGLSLPGDGETPSGASVPAPEFRYAMIDVLARSRAFGFAMTARLGLGACDLALPGDSDAGVRLCTAVGLGVEYSFGPLTAQLGPRFLIVDNESGTRKNLELRLGALYHFN